MVCLHIFRKLKVQSERRQRRTKCSRESTERYLVLLLGLDTTCCVLYSTQYLYKKKLTRQRIFVQNFSCLSLFSHYQINYRFTSGRIIDFGSLCSRLICQTPISCRPQASRAKQSAEICSTRRANALRGRRTRSSTSGCGTSSSAKARVYTTEMLKKTSRISLVHSC